jgi:hypothetical protein
MSPTAVARAVGKPTTPALDAGELAVATPEVNEVAPPSAASELILLE